MLSLSTPIGVLSIELDENSRVERVRLLPFNLGYLEVSRADASQNSIKEQLILYFCGKLRDIDYPVNLDRLNQIDREVLLFTKKIPFGEVLTYRDIARELSISPRRVGISLSRNPAPIVLPCHRIIMADGRLGGYIFGAEIKRWLINHERSILCKPQLHRI